MREFFNRGRLAGCSSFSKSLVLSAPCAAAIGMMGFASPTRALVIVPTFDSTITSDAKAAVIEAAINTDITNLETYISNPVTVTITFGEISSGLGQSSTYISTGTYSNYLSDLETKQTLSSVDTKALTSLGLTAPYAAPNPTANPVNASTSLTATVPLLRALGHTITLPVGATDSTIDFNAGIVNDARTGTLVVGDYDLQSVIGHEMDEVLDIGGPGSQLNSGNLAGAVSPLDLFRYSAPGTRSYTTSASAASYFSVDGGTTDLVHFNQAGLNGSDFADWGNGVIPAPSVGNNPPQVQDAFGSPYGGPANPQQPNLGVNEITALDAVGWNLTPAGLALEGSVPEPTSLGLLAMGGAALLGRRRRTAGR